MHASFILTKLLHHGQDPLEKYEDKEESKEIVVVGIEDVNKSLDHDLVIPYVRELDRDLGSYPAAPASPPRRTRRKIKTMSPNKASKKGWAQTE